LGTQKIVKKEEFAMKSKSKNFTGVLLIVLLAISLKSCEGGAGDSTNGTALRILSGYNQGACIDTYTHISNVYPRTLMAEGGAPSLGNGYTWRAQSLSTLPMGTTVFNGVFKSNGGILAGAGEYLVKIEVSDGPGGSTATGIFTFSVGTASSAPSGGIPMPGCPEFVLSQYTSYSPNNTFVLTDAYASKPYGASLFAMGGTPPYKWSLDTSGGLSILPSGLSLDPINGIIYGTPFQSTSGKTFKFSVIVKDNAGGTASGNGPVYSITVK
jgi:hypothetical protein